MSVNAVKLLAASTPGGFDSLIPAYVKDLAEKISLARNGSPEKLVDLVDVDDEVEDIARLIERPTMLVRYLDKFSLEFPASVNRAILAAALLETEDSGEDAVRIAVETWASMETPGRLELEKGWVQSARLQFAADKALATALDLQQRVRSFSPSQMPTQLHDSSRQRTTQPSEGLRPRRSSLKQAGQGQKTVRFGAKDPDIMDES